MLLMSFHPFFVMISTVDTTQMGDTGPPPVTEVGIASEALHIQDINKDYKYYYFIHISFFINSL